MKKIFITFLASLKNAIYDNFTIKNIRKNLQFFIDRIIVGTLFLIYMLYENVDINLNISSLLDKTLILLLVVLGASSIALYMQNFHPDNPVLLTWRHYITVFCKDAVSITISGFTVFLPFLFYGAVNENVGYIMYIWFLLALANYLEDTKLKLDALDPLNAKYEYEFFIECKK